MAESSNTNVTGVDEKDIISELPRNLQESILNCMPIRDAVRTSALSKQWRYCWTEIPDVIFAGQFRNNMSANLSNYHDPNLKAEEFIGVINTVLQLHNGPIFYFHLEFPEGLNAQVVSDYINQLIDPLLPGKGIKQLVLEDTKLGGPGYFDGGSGYYLEAHKFSSLKLTHLWLRGLRFRSTPAIGAFSHLTNLGLINVRADLDQQYVFNCPVLEKLFLAGCLGILHTNFSAPNLKCLYEKNIAIRLAGLKNITKFFFVLGIPNISMRYNVAELLGSLLNIEELFIQQYSIQYLAAGGSPDKVTKPLHFLKTLTISGINFADVSVLSCLLCLIRSGPNLRKLQISALRINHSDEVLQEDFRLEDFKDCTIGNLKIVVFKYPKGFTAEMEIIKFLLAHCPLLETMCIKWSGDIARDAASTMTKEIIQFSRLSPRAQLKCFEYPDGPV